MCHVRSNVRCELDRFAGVALEADAGHPVVENLGEINNHLLSPGMEFLRAVPPRLWTDLLLACMSVKCKCVIGPTLPLQCAMRAALALEGPSDAKRSSQHQARLGGWPLAHAAVSRMWTGWGRSSPCSRRFSDHAQRKRLHLE